MWLFTTEGFYSAVTYDPKDFAKFGGPNQDLADDARVIVVRSRLEIDLLRLVARGAERGIIPLEPITHTPSADYHWRVWFLERDWITMVTSMAADIDYPNYKSAVRETRGERRLDAYHRVWSAMYSLQDNYLGSVGVHQGTGHFLQDPMLGHVPPGMTDEVCFNGTNEIGLPEMDGDPFDVADETTPGIQDRINASLEKKTPPPKKKRTPKKPKTKKETNR